MGRRRRRRVVPTDDWEQLELLCVWEEQKEYERIRSLVLFGEPVPERTRVNSGGAVVRPGSPVARIARVRSPHLNRVTLCRTERHNYQLGGRNMNGQTNDF